MARLAWVVALAAASGCALDFDQFRVPLVRDGQVDAPEVDGVTDAADATACAVEQQARLRVAHMAWGFGAVDLCARRGGLVPQATFVRVGAGRWPSQGLGYGEVSLMGAPDVIPAHEHEAWEFVVVPHGGECTGPRVALVAAAIDPALRGTLLLTSQVTGDRISGVLGVLVDRACAECANRGVDVRAVHASLGAAALRLDMTMTVGPLGFTVAQNVPYGSAALNAQDGYECLTSWQPLLSETGPRATFSVRPSRGAELARSETTVIKGALLAMTHRATVFFEGQTGTALSAPGFVVCYDGIEDAGLTVCDRVRATVLDAGRDSGSDGAADSSLVDATHTDGMVADAVGTDAGATDATEDVPLNPGNDVGTGDEDSPAKDDVEDGDGR